MLTYLDFIPYRPNAFGNKSHAIYLVDQVSGFLLLYKVAEELRWLQSRGGSYLGYGESRLANESWRSIMWEWD